MTFTAEFILQLVVALGSGIGAYAAIRADLARLHERATRAIEAADKAHARIDALQERR